MKNMKKITVMSILLAILLIISNVVCAATNTSTNASVTASAATVVKGNTVDVTINFDDAVATGTYAIKYSKDGVLQYKSDTVNAQGKETKKSFAVNPATKKIVITFDVIGNVGDSTTVEFVPVAGSFGENVDDIKTINITGTAPTITVVESSSTVPDNTTDDPTTDNKTDDPTTDDPTIDDPTTEDPNTPNTETPDNTTEDIKNNDDERYDQTGVSIALVGAVAAIIIAGTVVIMKRK